MSVVVKIISKDFTRPGFEKASQRVRKLEQEVSRAVSRFKMLGVAAAAATGMAVNKFAQFDKGVREITTLLGDLTDKEIKRLGDEITDMAVKYGQALDKMTKARYDIISAGFADAAQSAVLLEQSAKLAVAGVSEVSKTADILTTVLNAYRMSVGEATAVSDILFTTVRLGKTTIDEIASGLGRAASIAPTVGVSLKELSAVLATLTAAGISTDEAVTAMTATMSAFLSPSKELTERINEAGYATGAAMVKALGFREALRRVTEGANEAEKAALFPNIRAMRAVFPLVGDLADSFAQNLQQLDSAAGATDQAFAKMEDSISMRMARMKMKFEKAFLAVGEMVAPVAEGIANIVDWFDKLEPASQKGVAAFAAVTTALYLLRGAIVAATGPMGLLYGLIGAVGAGVATWGVTKIADDLGDMAQGLDAAQIKADILSGKIKLTDDQLKEFQEVTGIKITFGEMLESGMIKPLDDAGVKIDEVKQKMQSIGDIDIGKIELEIDLKTGMGQKIEKPQVELILKPVLRESDLSQALNAERELLAEFADEVNALTIGRVFPPDELEEDKAFLAQTLSEEIEIIRQKQEERLQIQSELYGRSKELMLTQFEERLAAIDEYWQQNAELVQYWQDYINQLEQQANIQRMEKIDGYVGHVANVFTSLYNFRAAQIRANLESELQAERRRFQATVDYIRQTYTVGGKLTEEGRRRMAEAEERYNNRVSALREEARAKEISAARALKPVKLAQAISNVALAVTKALPNIWLAGLVGAMGAIQIATIAAQPYASGGVVEGQTIEFTPVGADVVPAMLRPGEVVVPAEQARQNRAQLQEIISGQSTPSKQVIIDVGGLNINVSAIDASGFDDLIRTTEFRDSLIQAINDGVIKIIIDEIGEARAWQ